MQLDEMILDVDQQIEIKADVETVYASLIHRLTEANGGGGTPMPMKLEQWPGGRWYRDLGEGIGHLWGHVQVIKPTTLIEIIGPMFMSYPVSGHLALRLTEESGVTTLSLRHRAIGLIDPNHREGVKQGWGGLMEDVKQNSES